MWQLLKAVKRQLGFPRRRGGRGRKSSRVADESLAGALQAQPDQQQGGGGGRGRPTSVGSLSVLLVVVRAPLAVASCLVGQADGAGAEEAWASAGERRPRTAEMDQLMVRDSMRYAIYV